MSVNTAFLRGILLLLFTIAATLSPVYAEGQAEALDEGVIDISDREYNRVVFPVPFTDIIFPANAPLKSDPVPLGGNRSILFEVHQGVRQTVQMVVQLEDGTVHTLRMRPAAIPGVEHRVAGASDRPKTSAVDTSQSAMRSQSEEQRYLLETFKRFVRGNRDNFTRVETLPTVEFDSFYAEPLEAWSNGTDRMLIYKLVSKGPRVVVASPQFYRSGVRAVQLEGGDVVSRRASPKLFILVDESVFFGSR
ncbi:TraK domain-containing protein [Thioalkalivibrio thiocyanodenitrificans]|uniref:TraK domain-containing protein n=1 Tax=Thioalkalivibrio thiocyanodenitrificans TaxID=243063 RepID=UPI00035E3D4C|nr:type-F conjugative transfer system secretin TraK [Thioalkalivibrio thiocyanodenitrificans]